MRIIIIGGGAAGMMAAISAKEYNKNATVEIFDGNEKLGKKIYITGKGRCNITNASDMETIFNNVVTNRKFLYSAFYTFTNDQIVELLENEGVKTKVERGNRIFPVSDKSGDVISGLERRLRKLGVKIHLHSKVREILVGTDDAFKGIKLDSGIIEKGERLIVATGGNSYQTTGSTGDGYKFAKATGHEVTSIRPALCPLILKEEYAKEMQGLSLKNVSATLLKDMGQKKPKQLYSEQGEMLFTHFGVSGPLILSGSSYVSSEFGKNKDAVLKLVVDMKPALTEEQLDKRLLRDFDENINKNFNNALDGLLPKKMIPVMIDYTGIDPFKKVNEVTKEERERLVQSIKNMTFTVTGLRGFNEAIITQGGVNVKDINPGTMESKHVKNMYFAGEVLDVDALTGGYNLQIAWSTGYLAGMSAAEETIV